MTRLMFNVMCLAVLPMFWHAFGWVLTRLIRALMSDPSDRSKRNQHNYSRNCRNHDRQRTKKCKKHIENKNTHTMNILYIQWGPMGFKLINWSRKPKETDLCLCAFILLETGRPDRVFICDDFRQTNVMSLFFFSWKCYEVVCDEKGCGDDALVCGDFLIIMGVEECLCCDGSCDEHECGADAVSCCVHFSGCFDKILSYCDKRFSMKSTGV